MKLSKILNLVALAALIAFSAVGCKRGLQKPTPLPGQQFGQVGTDTPNPLLEANGKKNTPDNNVPGIPTNPGGNQETSIPVNPNPGGTSVPTPVIPKPADGNPPGNIPVGDLSAYTPSANQPFSSETVYFDFDKSNVKPSEIPKLQRVATGMKNYQGKAIRVEGHCDERGTEEYNRALGERRALSIREHLVRLGVDAAKIDTISYGEDKPKDPGHNEAAFSKNRRGEFILLDPPARP